MFIWWGGRQRSESAPLYPCPLRFFAARCDVIPNNLPKFVILIRLGNFRLDLVGRMQIVIAASLIAMLLGFRLLVL
jgi:hypothetical protein